MTTNIPKGETKVLDQDHLSILMTEGTSISARQALYALGPQHTIDVLDPSPMCQCRFSSLVRKWIHCPSYSQDPCQYLRFLRQQIDHGQYDVLIPTHEEIFLISRVRDKLGELIPFAVPEFSSVGRLQSKIEFFDLLEELNLPYPSTEIFTSAEETAQWQKFPAFVKLEFGTAGKTVRKVANQQELQSAIDEFRRNDWWQTGAPLILQVPARGVQSVARAIFSRGKLIASHANVLCQRGIGGAAVARKSASHPVVTKHLQQLGEHLNWHGPMFIEYFYDPATQSPQYIEADPRIGDVGNATLCDVNFLEHWIDVALDRPSLAVVVEYPVVHSHMGMLILLSRALEGANRRQIAIEIWNQWRGKGDDATSFEEMVRPGEDRLSLIPFFWIAARLLLWPSVAHKVVTKTIDNYALDEDAAKQIREMPLDKLLDCLSGNHQ